MAALVDRIPTLESPRERFGEPDITSPLLCNSPRSGVCTRTCRRRSPFWQCWECAALCRSRYGHRPDGFRIQADVPVTQYHLLGLASHPFPAHTIVSTSMFAVVHALARRTFTPILFVPLIALVCEPYYIHLVRHPPHKITPTHSTSRHETHTHEARLHGCSPIGMSVASRGSPTPGLLLTSSRCFILSCS